MDIGHIIPHIEALLFASDKPLTPIDITELVNNAFGFMEDKITMEQVETAMEGIVEKYAAEFYPFEIRQSGGGWQFLTKKEYHKTVAQLNGEKYLKRLSGAALETLAIIAYKQPITKADIESIRGVNCDYSIQKLLEKELIVISGRNEELPGKPLIYNTSRTFMDYFGINSPEDLPKLKEIFTDNLVIPTSMNAHGETSETLPGEEGPREEGGLNGHVMSGHSEDETPMDPAVTEDEAAHVPALVVTPDGELHDGPVEDGGGEGGSVEDGADEDGDDDGSEDDGDEDIHVADDDDNEEVSEEIIDTDLDSGAENEENEEVGIEEDREEGEEGEVDEQGELSEVDEVPETQLDDEEEAEVAAKDETELGDDEVDDESAGDDDQNPEDDQKEDNQDV